MPSLHLGRVKDMLLSTLSTVPRNSLVTQSATPVVANRDSCQYGAAVRPGFTGRPNLARILNRF